MFKKGDIVRIRDEWRAPNETDRPYVIIGVISDRKQCYITAQHCDMVIHPQQLVSFDMIEPL